MKINLPESGSSSSERNNESFPFLSFCAKFVLCGLLLPMLQGQLFELSRIRRT
jgi:hypothetical protein